jgi:hypothetical protein
MGPLLPTEAHRHLVVFEDGICSVRRSVDRQETQTIGGLLLHIEMRPDVEDSEDAPMAPVVDLLNSDEPMGLPDRQIVKLLESDESRSADERFFE